MRNNRHLSIGPGGRKCICCFPAPGSKDRKLQYRNAKRAEIRAALKAEEVGNDTYYDIEIDSCREYH